MTYGKNNRGDEATLTFGEVVFLLALSSILVLTLGGRSPATAGAVPLAVAGALASDFAYYAWVFVLVVVGFVLVGICLEALRWALGWTVAIVEALLCMTFDVLVRVTGLNWLLDKLLGPEQQKETSEWLRGKRRPLP